MSNKNKLKLTKVLEVGNQLDLDNGEVVTGWTGSADVTAIAASTTHVTGANSISFAKSLTTETTGIISKTIGGANGKNGSMFAIQRLKLNLNLGSIADIASVSLTLGTDESNNNVYTTVDKALSTGWNELNYNCDDPTTVNGNGINWFDIKYVAVTVTLDATSDTLADILVDTICFHKVIKDEISNRTGEILNLIPGRLEALDVSSADSASYKNGMSVRVGTSGDVNVVDLHDNTVLIPNVQDGETLPFLVKQVLTASTTATGMVAGR